MSQSKTSERSNSGSIWTIACHICNRLPLNGDDLLQHYIDEHPRSTAARERTLIGTTTR